MVAVVTVLPTLFPVFTAGAVLVASGEGLQFASIVALIVAFGLSLNAAVHYLNRLRLEDRPGEDPAIGVERATVLIGPALVLTSLILAFGLGVTVLSDLPSLRLFGKLSALTLMAALIGDLLLLPASVLLWRRFMGRLRKEPSLEWHHERRQLLERRPAPGVEFLFVPFARTEIDLAVRAFEAGGEPDLLLAAIAALPGDAHERVGKIVGQPVAGSGHEARAADARFLGKLAARCGLGVFALIETALRHLPPRPGALRRVAAIGAPSDEGEAVAIEQHDADARPVGQPLLIGHSGKISLAGAPRR